MVFKASKNIDSGSHEFKKLLEQQQPYAWIHAPGRTQAKLSATKSKLPNKIMTLQDAYGGIGNSELSTIWPGHLLYKAGTLLNNNLSANDDTLLVQDISRISNNPNRANKAKKKMALTIYALDENGKPDWSRTEHLMLEKIHNGKIKVRRGQWNTKPLAFKAGKAVVASHMMYWTNQFQLNFSLDCPRGGPDNLTAAEWFARTMAKRVLDSNADGIEFDVTRWTWGYPERSPMDANNDLIPDYGYLNGVNSFGLGGQVFFRELRKLLGPDKIIQADSNDAIAGARGWNYLNGIQMEAFPMTNDYDRFSQAFLHLRLWSENAQVTPKVSYPFTKGPTTVFAQAYMPNGAKTDFRFRVGFAAACLTNMPHAFASLKKGKFDPANAEENDSDDDKQFGVFNWDEYHGGELHNWSWLGRPISPAHQDLSDMDANNLLAQASWEWVTDKSFTAETIQSGTSYNATIKAVPPTALPEKLRQGIQLMPKNINLKLTPGHGYTLEFEARGDDSWNYANQKFDHVPRLITITGAVTGKKETPLAVLADAQWRTYKLSFIANNSSLTTPVFGVSEQIGKTEIRNIKLYSGSSERWSREFENGLVLLNMTNTPWQANVKKNYYKRLKGSQAPEVNNGESVDSTITVPARDAIFLVKK
ncbi:hypothetical protein VZ94_19105 [Methylocucumis oryzae]|uniref:CBM-cenC domain-containing protein n=2 Tax=Methylocucumis oryzae TaxID=1632867 RepID=A0A0F3IFJ8_9GAMM|nr:hypothetical protein VZ94_19105 [Methylocucumis oryzae]